MQMLLDQYRRIGLWLFGVSTFLLALGYTQMVPLLETSDTKWFISFVTTSGFYGVVYGGGLFLYRKLGWRVLNWRLCHHGRWHSITIVVSGKNEGKILSRGMARIHQDALSIHLEGWTSASTSWKVESVTYDRQFNGVIVYMASTVHPACGFKYNVHGIGRFSRRLFTPDKPYHQNVFKKSAWWALRKQRWYDRASRSKKSCWCFSAMSGGVNLKIGKPKSFTILGSGSPGSILRH